MSDGCTRLRAATRANSLVLAAIVAAVAFPLAVHYTGLAPAGNLKVLKYPHLQWYILRLTPSVGQHGLDFSQIWFSTAFLKAGKPVYFPVKPFDQFRRRWSSTYHPFAHWLYIPIGGLPFRTALILHNLIGIAVLLLCVALALRRAACFRAFPGIAAVILAAMFLTPTGLLHLERGQMDIYVAAAFVCIVALLAGGGSGWGIATGVLSTLKVPAWPFVGFYWLVAAPLGGLRRWAVWWAPATIVLLNLAFFDQLQKWLPAVRYVAENVSIGGPSFTQVLPKALVFTLPLVSTLAIGVASFASLRSRQLLEDATARRELLERISFPFAATLALQTVCGTPVTHDYRMVAFLGLLPGLAIWCQRAPSIAAWARNAMALAFSAVLVVAMRVRPFTELSHATLAWVLLLASLGFLLAALGLACHGLGRRIAAPRAEPTAGGPFSPEVTPGDSLPGTDT